MSAPRFAHKLNQWEIQSLTLQHWNYPYSSNMGAGFMLYRTSYQNCTNGPDMEYYYIKGRKYMRRLAYAKLSCHLFGCLEILPRRLDMEVTEKHDLVHL
jgi:hypothetical protein